ncbi:hypothetical protein N7509_004895 [Penicillium cosmopolitanum]|uniref:Uncharacterized protein n=1 Tax=Penicillium cosmopolitanum TaxID=1131564 RepID=A0A9X0B9K7_9EURO|nr:uncharacterized protein N7509_004895 [Penicillium cosmopolitanum]KAJ5396782.1 hypothetical protein N7509_004895 [Penicillium cosmopolitanum]
MFEGMINGYAQTDLADSGLKFLVMDEKYARSIGVEIHTAHRHCTRLKFADNSVAKTAGMAYDFEWCFGRDNEISPPRILNFHILENAPANVILNDALLFDTKAFSKYLDYLIDDDDDYNYEFEEEGMHIYFFAIDFDKKTRQGQGVLAS